MQKKFTLLSILLLFTSNVFSQNLTIDELISLRKKNIAEVEEYLTNKGWIYSWGNEPTEDEMGKAVFTFNKSNYDDSAQSFVSYIYSETRKRLDIQVMKVDIYNSYITRIKSLGCKLINSKIEDGNIVKIYQGATTTIEIAIITPKSDTKNDKTYYTFFIIENSDYFKNFSE